VGRYDRDELIAQGLDLAASPTLVAHDMPGGTVDPEAYAIQWLQNALDMFHMRFPFSADVASVGVTFRAGNPDVILSDGTNMYLPSNWIVDVRNGLLMQQSPTQSYRLRRTSFQSWLDRSTLSPSGLSAGAYCVAQNRLKIVPTVPTQMSGTLWYYALPAPLDAHDSPNFPDPWVLIEFVRFKALEWTRSADPGTAQAYMQRQLASLRATGLLNEPEYDVVPLENNQAWRDQTASPYAWMGRTTP